MEIEEVGEAYEVRIKGRKPLGFDNKNDAKLFCLELRRMGANASYRKVA